MFNKRWKMLSATNQCSINYIFAPLLEILAYTREDKTITNQKIGF